MPEAARHLLPPNATPLERTLVTTGLKRHAPEVIAQLWNPATCPAQLLPWLAWAFSLDEWDPAWTEPQQRDMVRSAIQLHRKKGTRWAVRHALLRSGLEGINITERPAGAHWAEFDVDIAVVDRPLTEEAMQRAIALIDAYKPVRCTLRTLRTSLQTQGGLGVAMQQLGGDTTVVYPIEPDDITPEAVRSGMSIAALDGVTTNIYPQ